MDTQFIFSNLPIEIINYIFDYTGKIYYHNGKYIGKIDINNNKYHKIFFIPKPIQISYNKYNLYLINKDTSVGYILHYTLNVLANLTMLQLIFNTNYTSKTVEWFIIPFNINSKWRRVVSLPNLNY